MSQKNIHHQNKSAPMALGTSEIESVETLYTEGSCYYADLLNDISNAKENIDLEAYIFAIDSVGEQFISALSKASTKGVAVRLLVDGNGLSWFSNSFFEPLARTRVQVRLFHPLPWRFWQWKHATLDRPLLTRALHFITSINHRNHRKVCTIDHRIAWIGSFNIDQCHLSKPLGGENWHDTAIRLQSVDTAVLEQAFEQAWRHKRLKKSELKKMNPASRFRLNNSRKRRRFLHSDLLARIAACQQRIWITNAYFVPDEPLLKQLKKAARRGIDVRIILPGESDVFFMPWTSSVFYQSLLKHGVRILEYVPGVLHAKTLMVDDWMTVGSSNLNCRSLLHDLEVDVVISEQATKQQLIRQFHENMRRSSEISLAQYPRRSWWKRMFAHLLLSAKYWL